MCNDNSQNYYYRVYGLKILSHILISELSPLTCNQDECHDIEILYGTAQRTIHHAIVDNENLKMSKDESYFYIAGVAGYYIGFGQRIIVEPEVGSDKHEVNVFLLGTSLGLLLTQRNIIAIHGGTVVIDGKGILITGQTGAGKSSLTSALRQNGYKFLADDVSALGEDGKGDIVIYPAIPQAKLCADAMKRMGYDPEKYHQTDFIRDKYAIPLYDSFLDHAVPLSHIFEIRVDECNRVELVEITGVEKIRLILKNIYRIEITRFLGLDPSLLKKCLQVAGSTQMFSILRPKEGFTVDEQIGLVKSALAFTSRIPHPVELA